MDLGWVRQLYDYHWWANRKLWNTTVALGDAVATREIGTQFSVPTLTQMFTHLYGADLVWLRRWRGAPIQGLPSDTEFSDMKALRGCWDELQAAQKVFIDALTPADLTRSVAYKSPVLAGEFSSPLGALLIHVANHATHHRSEVATMLTMVSGSPPSTDFIVWQLMTAGQRPA